MRCGTVFIERHFPNSDLPTKVRDLSWAEKEIKQKPHSLRDGRVGFDSMPRGESQRRPLGRARMIRCVCRRHGLPGNRGKDSLLWWRVEHMIVDERRSLANAAGVLHKEGVPICNHVLHSSRIGGDEARAKGQAPRLTHPTKA